MRVHVQSVRCVRVCLFIYFRVFGAPKTLFLLPIQCHEGRLDKAGFCVF